MYFYGQTCLVQKFNVEGLKTNTAEKKKKKQQHEVELDVVSLKGLELLHFCQVCSVFIVFFRGSLPKNQ